MSALSDIERELSELELALLRRGMDQRMAGQECCSGCNRSPLIGERVYVYGAERIVCALCRARERRPPTGSRLVHTPAFGHTLRIIDQRAA
jgi:LSD1 subclass zinc finger protein